MLMNFGGDEAKADLFSSEVRLCCQGELWPALVWMPAAVPPSWVFTGLPSGVEQQGDLPHLLCATMSEWSSKYSHKYSWRAGYSTWPETQAVFLVLSRHVMMESPGRICSFWARIYFSDNIFHNGGVFLTHFSLKILILSVLFCTNLFKTENMKVSWGFEAREKPEGHFSSEKNTTSRLFFFIYSMIPKT